MTTAICSSCIEDAHLREALKGHFEELECTECGEVSDEAVTVDSLTAVIEPVLREHFHQGEQEKHFGENDSEWWEQAGEPLNEVIQEVTGQYFSFEDELIGAVCDLDDAWIPDGDEPIWDTTANYVSRRLRPYEFAANWATAIEDVKRSRRFYSTAARQLFDRLFSGVQHMLAVDNGEKLPVSIEMPVGSELFRARVCSSVETMKTIVSDAAKHVGPPPGELAKAGRMNPEGVVVLYAAYDADTARAELRPAIGNDLAVIKLITTRPLRVLDLERLERVTAPSTLSYFQEDFEEQVTRHAFLRRLHRLISQPVVPGRESDYLITQMMAEYLAYVHEEQFDGIKFSSAQKSGGTNVVLLSRFADDTSSIDDRYGVTYVADNLCFSKTTGVQYMHVPVTYVERDDGGSIVYFEDKTYYDDDME
ncbi:RES family NAD+ phosphorylase [Paraburkholderia agricolaris]|uniref:RES family NAD+ phosphorylase n=1 Tax=Paraburkholderia agricolaris TaxID=2152888 RepID=A0ABW8ZI41_9BURK